MIKLLVMLSLVRAGTQIPLIHHQHILNLGYPYLTDFDNGDVATAVRGLCSTLCSWGLCRPCHGGMMNVIRWTI